MVSDRIAARIEAVVTAVGAHARLGAVIDRRLAIARAVGTDPDAIRRYERDLKVLERHDKEPGLRTIWHCRTCGPRSAPGGGFCADVLDLFDVYTAAKAFREAAANPKHSQFWRQPWSEMADLCRAVDQLGEASNVD